MSSSDALHPQQLRMFIPAGELVKMKPTSHPTSMPHGLWREGRNRENEWKWEDNRQEDQYLAIGEGGATERIGESIREHGVIHPVEVGPDYVSEGHHRIAISEGIDPTREIPVVHI